MGGAAPADVKMKLIEGGNRHMSEEFRKGMWEGKKRIAGVTASEMSEDELLGLIFVFECVLSNMKSKVLGLRRKRRKDFRLELVQ